MAVRDMEQHVPPTWRQPRHPGRPRLLIEDPNAALAGSEFRLFEEAGFEVALCAGPDADHPCPLVEHGVCDLARDADVVLVGLMEPEDQTEVAAAIRHHVPDTPVVFEVRRSRGPCTEVPDGCQTLMFPSSVNGQIDVLWKALSARRAHAH